ncbi:carboxypeptidase-like regulatory domain-containing protein [Chryseobacterium sp. POE27]|uniref:carboxypeptidase-like regulatory domain-containing protein n=1 Tax=Chryseobacterium sp. POE27 TaxID=3138177 RepID=UPI0032193A5D
MMKKLSLVSLFTLLPASYYFAQTIVSAYLKDVDGKPIERAEVEIKGRDNEVTADKIGYFQFVDVMPGHYQIVITKPNYETKVMEFEVEDNEKKKDLGIITLFPEPTAADQGLVIIDNSSSDDEEGSGQTSTVGLLQSSQDVFSKIASFDLGFYGFRPRGVDGRASENILNGISMVKSDNGNVDFSNWGGLNEIVRYPETSANHSPSEYVFGGVNGTIYKNTKSSEYRKGFQVSYSATNRNYRQRLTLRYTSGMNKNGWAFTIMGAKRWAEEGIQEGTFYDGYGTYLGIEKKINDNHTITFNAFASPYRRSVSSPNTQEVYDYRGIHYNSYWGWQNGEKRNERIRKGFQPIFQLQDFWKINGKSNLWSSVSYQSGKDKGSRLDWQNAQNPSPTYNKKLPGYYLNSITYSQLHNNTPADQYEMLQQGYLTAHENWVNNNQDVTQINWNALYTANRNSADKSARYFLVNDVSDDKILNAATHYTYNVNDTSRFFLNISYQNFKSENYREINDLLGADYALNIDPYADSNKRGSSGLYNVNDPETHKQVGDKLNYDYIVRKQEIKINPGFKFSKGHFDIFVSGLIAYSTSNREGLFRNYLYQNNSFGKSNDFNYLNGGIKGQLVYRLNGRNFFVYNGAYFSQAPFLDDIFINPRANNYSVPNIKNAVISANDINYVISTPFIKLRATGYIVDVKNDTNVQRFFADGLQISVSDGTSIQDKTASAFVTQTMSKVDKRNMGVELGIDVKVLPALSLQGAASWGDFRYTNNPEVYISSDVMAAPYSDLGTAYIKNFKVGGTAQKAFCAGFSYNSPKYWRFGASWNYLDDNNLDPSAILRTDEFIQNNNSNTPFVNLDGSKVEHYIKQVQFPSAFFFNANVGKSWLFGKYYVLVSGSVNNILDNKRYITGGFEQIRSANGDVDFENDFSSKYPNFAPKYWYQQGRSYFISLQVRF